MPEKKIHRILHEEGQPLTLWADVVDEQGGQILHADMEQVVLGSWTLEVHRFGDNPDKPIFVGAKGMFRGAAGNIHDQFHEPVHALVQTTGGWKQGGGYTFGGPLSFPITNVRHCRILHDPDANENTPTALFNGANFSGLNYTDATGRVTGFAAGALAGWDFYQGATVQIVSGTNLTAGEYEILSKISDVELAIDNQAGSGNNTDTVLSLQKNNGVNWRGGNSYYVEYTLTTRNLGKVNVDFLVQILPRKST